MSPTLKISVAQFKPQPLSPEANFAKATEEIRAVAGQGSHIVVLPEYHLTSWIPEDPGFVDCCAQSAPYLSRYQELARELNIHIVPGTFIEVIAASAAHVSNDDARAFAKDAGGDTEPKMMELRNVAYFIAASSGEILGSYQKKNLWHPERGVLTPDLRTAHTSFSIPIPGSPSTTIRTGLLICWDLAFPEAFRELSVASGAELIIIPAFWHTKEISPRVLSLNSQSEVTFLDSAVVSRAYENTCAVAFCNAFGQSQVAVPIVGSLGKKEEDEEGSLTCEVDFEVIRVAEETYKLRGDAQGEGWHYSRAAV